ncbi:hypothetical protein BJV82DRAFT_635036, partial [Fennellomyces sp. T-0311]
MFFFKGQAQRTESGGNSAGSSEVQNDESDELNTALLGETEGVIQVTASDSNEEEPELQRLRRIKPFQPLIKESERSFGLESLLGITIGLKSATNMKDDNDEINHKDLAEILIELQKYTEKHKRKIHQDQGLLLQRVKHVEGLSVRTAQALTLGLNQAKNASEKLIEVKRIAAYAQSTRKYAVDILSRLHAINEHIDKEDRIGHASFASRWPDLEKLYRKALDGRPPMDIMKVPIRRPADPSLVTVTKVFAEGNSSAHTDDS